MPSNKTFTIIILCFAVVVSIWLISRSPRADASLSSKTSVVSVSTDAHANASTSTNDDWKKLLTTVTESNQPVEDLTQKNNDYIFDGTTVTAQVAQDFMSKYLSIKESGGTISAQDAQSIANSVLANPAYTNPGPVYVASNLHITNSVDINTATQYKNAVNLILKTRSMQVTTGPIALLNTAVGSNDVGPLSRLTNLISIGKGMIQDLLAVSVPKDAVSVHLELMNATSNLTHSLEAMQVTFSDPVKSYIGINQYNQDMLNFQNALKDMNAYFVRKTGSAT